MIGHVLAQCERAVGVESWQHLYAVVELAHHLNAFCEALCVLVAPPLAQVAVLVVLGSLVVESVSHLMSDDYTDGSVVEGIVGLHVEEWGLQNAGREAYLVGGGIVVGVHGLRCHEPLVAIYRLVELRANHLLDFPLVAGKNIAQITIANLKFGIVLPFVGVAHLHIEGIQLLLSHFLGFVAHPLLNLDALAKGNLKVGNKALHTFLGFWGEETLDIELTKCFAQASFNSGYCTLPTWTVLCLSAHGSAVESKIHGTTLIVDIRAGEVNSVPEVDVLQGFFGLFLQHLLNLVDGLGLT